MFSACGECWRRSPGSRRTDSTVEFRVRPAAGRRDRATAQCNDSTYIYSQHRSGTCSGHGGVKQWL
ncbi:DUF3761 domain-containing protein [Amycolatopsis sp. La24]|uniref:DUF3761 domain-containing protein n=1 Tax=Amycolatopsis sp. La24 TaxID=3028304 RepID=UPI00099CDB46|nr:DUF3761 domain-containing protein [Amycolatopsis sp. La24]